MNKVRVTVAAAVALCFLNLVVLLFQIHLINQAGWSEENIFGITASDALSYTVEMLVLIMLMYPLTGGKRSTWMLAIIATAFIFIKDSSEILSTICELISDYHEIYLDIFLILEIFRVMLILFVAILLNTETLRSHCLSVPEDTAANKHLSVAGRIMTIFGLVVMFVSLLLTWITFSLSGIAYDGLSYIDEFGVSLLSEPRYLLLWVIAAVSIPALLSAASFLHRISERFLSLWAVTCGATGVLTGIYWWYTNIYLEMSSGSVVIGPGYYLSLIAGLITLTGGIIISLSVARLHIRKSAKPETA